MTSAAMCSWSLTEPPAGRSTAQDGSIAKAFLAAVSKVAAFKIHNTLTDNGKEFTDRLFGSRRSQPTSEREFDQLCRSLCIEH